MKNSTHKIKSNVLRSAIIAALFSAATSASYADEAIKIAIVGPSTGQLAQYGEMQSVGANMAIQQLNKSGELAGKTLVGVPYDDACDPKQAVAVANKVVNDGIKFVVGHVCSSSTQPASDIYEDEGILMITAASTNPEITNRGYKLLFRTIGLDNTQAPVAAQYIVDHVKPKSIAIIHDKQQYGEGIATEVKRNLEKQGQTVAMFEGINAGDKDYSAIISKLKRQNIDFVYFGGYHPELGLILRQSREKGFNAQFMSTEGVGNKELTAIAGKAAEGLLVTLPKAFDEDPRNQPLVQAFKDAKADPSGIFVLPAYAAVEVLAKSIKDSGSTDVQKVAETIRAESFDTPIGTLQFNEKGDLKNFGFVVYDWHSDGTKTLAKK
jgi:branched-chain amino acid transport system substrate-binding protein